MNSARALTWQPVGPDVTTVLGQFDQPLEELAAGRIPAIILRQAYPADQCRQLVQRLIAQDLLFDPDQPMPDRFQDQSIPEGYYREGKQEMEQRVRRVMPDQDKTRIDIGTSLGYRGSDSDAFFAHAAETRDLFSRLFDGFVDPVELTYSALSRLSRTQQAVTAYEADGRRYGPAIIRAHYGGYSYKPHFDSVRLRENRADYSVYEFDHQFAGVLVLQNTSLGEQSAQCILHQYLWQPEVDPFLKEGTFHEFAADRQIENVRVVLEPGDLYFFNTRAIHEVPGVAGDLPRIVLATFIGYSLDRPEIFVWS